MELILASPYQYIRRGAGEEYLFDLTDSASALVDLSKRSASARTLNGLNAHLNQLGTLQLSNLPSSRAPCPTDGSAMESRFGGMARVLVGRR